MPAPRCGIEGTSAASARRELIGSFVSAPAPAISEPSFRKSFREGMDFSSPEVTVREAF
jgi:hypothetical protein